jgi:hypothetical protein
MKIELHELKKGETGLGILVERDAGFIKPYEQNIIKEGTNKFEWTIPYPFVIHAVFQKADTPNANGRVYPRAILEREIEKFNQKIADRRGYGQSDHPSDTIIAISGLSLNIIELHWEANTVVGSMELLISPGYINYGIVSTPGDQMANLIYFNKVKIGVSSRGVGSVEKKKDLAYVQSDFELLCWDSVSDPSTPNAWANIDMEKLKPYIESNETSQTKSKINEITKSSIIGKLDKLLTEHNS